MSSRTGWAIMVAAMITTMSLCAAPPKEGDVFPDLKKAKLEGTLPDLAGKVVLVDFWASWCGPCKQSFPAMERLHQEFGSRGLVVLAISVDEDKKNMEAFLKDHAVTFAVVRDSQQKLVESVSIETMPTSFLLDGKGRIVAVHRKYEGKATEEQLRKEIEKQVELIKGDQGR